MKKLSIFIILLSIIDVVLLTVILTSVYKKPAEDINEEEVIEASVDEEEVSNKPKKEMLKKDKEEAKQKAEEDSVDEIETSEYDVEGIEGIVDIEEDGSDIFGPDLATTERPSLSDFMWYFDGVYYNGIPDGVTYVYDSEQMNGDWKGFIFLDPERKVNSYAFQFMNVNLSIDGQRAFVVFDMYQYCPENSEAFDMNGEKQEYSGNFESGAVYATGIGNVHIDTFYFGADNRQYAVGYLDTPDGTPAYLALVRP